ncbi:MAG: LysO family transporter [Fusobacteriaceae bacterium]
MLRILLYVVIILIGIYLSKKKLIPKSIDKRTGKLQTLSLFFLLGTMGYKIGTDETILSNLHKIGLESFIIAFFTIVGSILCTKIVFKIIRKKEVR